jgi:hypothetical protein
MGKMWKYEPEDPKDDGKKYLKGKQFVGYQTPTTIDYETDNDGTAIIPEPKGKMGVKNRSRYDL